MLYTCINAFTNIYTHARAHACIYVYLYYNAVQVTVAAHTAI